MERSGACGFRHQRADFGHADVDGDVLAQQFGGDAEVDIGGHAIAGVVGDDQDAARCGRANDAESFLLGHRNFPANCHHVRGITAAAASRSASLA